MLTDEELVQRALDMRERAYAPYSGFAVGAALESEDGAVFGGCNVENAAYAECICAERTAVVKAISEGHGRFRRIAVAGSSGQPCWPCGACRQVLSEFAPELTLLVSDQEGVFLKLPLSDILPHHFGSENLVELP